MPFIVRRKGTGRFHSRGVSSNSGTRSSEPERTNTSDSVLSSYCGSPLSVLRVMEGSESCQPKPKVDNIANYIKSQEFEARNAKTEIARLQSRQAAAENKVERLKGLLKYFMDARGLRSMEGRLNTISLRKNSQDSLVVDSIERIPSEYCRVSITLLLSEFEELLQHLPEEHSLRAHLTPEGNGLVRREPDNTKLRTALASGVLVQGADALHRAPALMRAEVLRWRATLAHEPRVAARTVTTGVEKTS